jgi:20S proteasome alpha/beta subunit
MTVDEGVHLGVKCIHTALERDAATGNNVRVMKITANGVEEVSKETIAQIRTELAK